jgi:diguanylate cyclase (GGDEF)-like protein
MPDLKSIGFAAFSAQTLGAAILAILFLAFFRQYRKEYLLHWTRSWTALTLFLVVRNAPWVAARMAAGALALLHAGLLLFGVYDIVRRRPVRIREARLILIALAVAGAASAFAPQVVRTSLSALAFAGAALALWRVRMRRQGIGFAITACIFLLYGVMALFAEALEFVPQMMLGVGMIVCLLDDEREANELATNEIEHLAYHDALTGMPNRPLFVDRLIVALAQAKRTNQRLAVFFLDLDRFKDINDSLGHTTGDVLLRALAERVRRCVREGDTVARFGGDEFTLLIPRIESVEDAAKIAQKILETVKIPVLIGEHELFVTTSIGISIFPGDGADPETLVRNADTAMYRAKEQGRDSYQLYAPAMNARALERLALENMLRKAITNDELVVYYQPLVELPSRTMHGVEALVRWQHPDLGLLSPAHFISVAELSGLIIPMGNWVLRSACKQVFQWNKRHGMRLSVSVNLSARQFSQPDLVEQVRAALRDTALSPELLELEITESNAMQNAENTIHTLRELKNAGVRISMDDFGTGYSSLSYLKRFPIDTLKLDQSFVRDIAAGSSDAAIVSAAILMAHSLGLTVVAEGVETEEQLAFLQKQRCDRIQGFLFSAPVAAADLEPFIVAQRSVRAG